MNKNILDEIDVVDDRFESSQYFDNDSSETESSESDLEGYANQSEEDNENEEKMVFSTIETDIFQHSSIRPILKKEYLDSIKKIRTLMVTLKRSNKQRDILRKYTELAPIVDVPTRWNSTLAMLKRFIRLGKPLKKASLDSMEIKSKMIHDEKTILALRAIINILDPFDAATKGLSKSCVNLHSADLIIQILLDGLAQFPVLRQRTIEKIESRRMFWSDIILWLKDDTNGIELYQPVDYIQVAELYNQVNYKFLS